MRSTVAESAQHLLGVALERVGREARAQVADRPPLVALDEVEELLGGGGELLQAEVAVEEDRGDLRALEQVLDVAVGAAQLLDAGRQLGVDRLQLLVHRGELLLRGLELLVGGLQLLVHRGELLVGRLQLLVRGFELLGGGLEPLVHRPELVLEVLDRGGLAVLDRLVRELLVALDAADVAEDHEEGRVLLLAVAAQRLHHQVDQLPAAVGADGDLVLHHDRPGRGGAVEGAAQVEPEAGPRHADDVVVGGAGGQLEVLAGPRRDVQDVAVRVHHRVRRPEAVEDLALGQPLQAAVGGAPAASAAGLASAAARGSRAGIPAAASGPRAGGGRCAAPCRRW